MVSSHDVLLETEGKIATVTLNRPKARNAFDRSQEAIKVMITP